jgi:protein-disulfide isomerase
MRQKPNLCLLAVWLSVAVAVSAQPQKPQKQEGAATAPASTPDCGCEIALPPDVLAIVNGVRITSREIDEPLREQIDSLQQQVIDARKRELYLQINSRLLEAEARKRGISAIELLQREVVAKVSDPTEVEARAFYEQNKSQFQAEFKAAQPDIVALLRRQREGDEAKKLANQLRATAQIKMLVQEATPPRSSADRERVLASVNGEQITSAAVEESLQPLIAQVQQRIYNLRQQQLELRINDTLLQQEALRRKITVNALLDTEVAPKVKKLAETDALVFYEQNKARISGEFAQVKSQLLSWLQELENHNVFAAFAQQLRQAASIQTYLTAPAPLRYSIATDDQPMKGAPSALVTLIVFTDYECPSCAQTAPILEQLLEEFAGQVRLFVRDFPLEQHAYSRKAAEAAEAARAQGRYWEYHTLLFRNQKMLDLNKLKEYASQLQLDRQQFDAALETGKYAAHVQRDVQDGLRLGLNSTPTIFINGQPVREKTYAALKAAIVTELKQTSQSFR